MRGTRGVLGELINEARNFQGGIEALQHQRWQREQDAQFDASMTEHENTIDRIINEASNNSLSNSPQDAQDWWNDNDTIMSSQGQPAPALPGTEPVPEARAASAGTGGPNPVSKETPISNYPTLTYELS